MPSPPDAEGEELRMTVIQSDDGSFMTLMLMVIMVVMVMVILLHAMFRLSPGAPTSRESILANDFIILKHMSAISRWCQSILGAGAAMTQESYALYYIQWISSKGQEVCFFGCTYIYFLQLGFYIAKIISDTFGNF